MPRFPIFEWDRAPAIYTAVYNPALSIVRPYRFQTVLHSASSCSIFNLKVAREIQIELSRNQETFIRISSGILQAWKASIEFEIPLIEARISSEVYFAEDLGIPAEGIFGIKGFFDRFPVTIDWPGREIVLDSGEPP